MSTELATMGSNALILDESIMVSMYKLAEMMASSRVTVPDHLRNSPGDCMAICMQSAQWGMNPFAVAQKTHLVGGNLGYEAQLVNAVVSSSKAIKGRFSYEYRDWHPAKEQRTKKGGGTYTVNTEAGYVRVGAVLAGETDITWSEWLNTALVTTKNSPLWNTAPRQQAAYLAVKYWARLYCPEVIMGVYSADEWEDSEPMANEEKDITPEAEQPTQKTTRAEDMLTNIPTSQKPETNISKTVEIETSENQPEQPHEMVSQDVSHETEPTPAADELAEQERSAKISAFVEGQIKAYDEAAGYPGKQKQIVELTKKRLVNAPDWMESFKQAIA